MVGMGHRARGTRRPVAPSARLTMKEMGRGLPWPPGGACRVGSGLVVGHHRRQDEADAALAILRAEIPDYDRRVAGGEVARVGVAAASHATPGNQNARKNKANAADNVSRNLGQRYGNSKTYLISRLKRDAADPACPGRTQARHWLKRLEAADISTRQASLAMGYVKPIASIPVDTWSSANWTGHSGANWTPYVASR